MQRSSYLLIGLLAACGTIEVPEAESNRRGNETPDPTLESISPERGPLAGGNEVTLTGTGFEEGTVVVIGGVATAAPTIESDTSLTVEVPAGNAEDTPFDVLIFGPSGFAALPEAYTYNPVPTVLALSKRFGPLAGGQVVEVVGEFLQDNNPGTPTVTVGGSEATNVEVLSDTTIRFTTPEGVADDVALAQDVVVSTANGDARLEKAYTFFRPGFLLASKRSIPQFGTGLFYFDLMSERLAKLVDTSGGFSRFFTTDEGSILFRHNNDGAGLHGKMSRLDVQTGALDFEGEMTDAVSSGSVLIRSSTRSGANFLALAFGQLGFVDVVANTFSPINGSSVNDFESCLGPKNSTEVHRITRLDGIIETINIASGNAVGSLPLSGDFGVQRPNEFICHGAALVGPDLFAIFTPRGGSVDGEVTLFVSINPATGVGTPLARIPGLFADLEPTPPGVFQ